MPVSWWPPAAAWWCLLALVATWMIFAVVAASFRYLRNAYRRQALRELDELANSVSQPNQMVRDESWESNLSKLLKRVALVAFSREKVAALSGDKWLRFLDDTCDHVDFVHGPARVLGSVSYDPNLGHVGDADAEKIIHMARKWIHGHRAETLG